MICNMFFIFLSKDFFMFNVQKEKYKNWFLKNVYRVKTNTNKEKILYCRWNEGKVLKCA